MLFRSQTTITYPNDITTWKSWTKYSKSSIIKIYETTTSKKSVSCYTKNYKEIYITATGEVYPCCFLGFYPSTMHHPGNNELKQLVKENNALEYPLEHCLNWFDSVEQSWSKSSIREGRTYQCITTCNKPKLS